METQKSDIGAWGKKDGKDEFLDQFDHARSIGDIGFGQKSIFHIEQLRFSSHHQSMRFPKFLYREWVRD